LEEDIYREEEKEVVDGLLLSTVDGPELKVLVEMVVEVGGEVIDRPEFGTQVAPGI
jgi:hypothetical protein